MAAAAKKAKMTLSQFVTSEDDLEGDEWQAVRDWGGSSPAGMIEVFTEKKEQVANWFKYIPFATGDYAIPNFWLTSGMSQLTGCSFYFLSVDNYGDFKTGCFDSKGYYRNPSPQGNTEEQIPFCPGTATHQVLKVNESGDESYVAEQVNENMLAWNMISYKGDKATLDALKKDKYGFAGNYPYKLSLKAQLYGKGACIAIGTTCNQEVLCGLKCDQGIFFINGAETGYKGKNRTVVGSMNSQWTGFINFVKALNSEGIITVNGAGDDGFILDIENKL